MLCLHHLEYSQSFRILWLLEELGIDYELQIYERDKKTLLAPESYKAVSPLGTAPVITDGDMQLAETNAIVEYILSKAPENNLAPKSDAEDFSRHLFWFHASQGSMMPLMLMLAVLKIAQSRVPFFIKPLMNAIVNQLQGGFINPRMTALLDKAEADLSAKPWFGGDSLSTADIVMSYNMEAAASRGQLGENYPNCHDWFKRVQARPAYQSAREKDGRESNMLSF